MGWLQRREWLLKMSKHEPLQRSISHESLEPGVKVVQQHKLIP